MASWDDITAELYTLPPAGFTRARDAHAADARKAGDRALADRIRALRRPTVAAFALNLFSRHRDRQVEQLLELGRELREAQASWSGARLRELAAQRAHLVAELAVEAVQEAEDAGQQVSGAARAEVEQSLRAVLADPAAAEQFAEGRLATALEEPTGFGTLDGSPPPRPRPRPSAERPRAGRRAEEDGAQRRARQKDAKAAVREAERELREAGRRRDRAATAADRAHRSADEARARVQEAREALRRAEEEAETAGRELSEQESERADAEREVDRVERALAEARQRLEDLES